MHKPPPNPPSTRATAGKPPGRPRALDEFKRREICAIVSAGGGLDAAAYYVGCSIVTIRREMMRDPEFFAQLRSAECESQLSPLKTMQKAAATHWRAAAWYLERTQPDRFTPKVRGGYSEEVMQQFLEALSIAIVEQIDDDDTAGRVLAAIGEVTRKFELEERAELYLPRRPCPPATRARSESQPAVIAAHLRRQE